MNTEYTDPRIFEAKALMDAGTNFSDAVGLLVQKYAIPYNFAMHCCHIVKQMQYAESEYIRLGFPDHSTMTTLIHQKTGLSRYNAGRFWSALHEHYTLKIGRDLHLQAEKDNYMNGEPSTP